MQKRGAPRSSGAATADASHHAHGLVAQSPFMTLVVVVVLAIATWFFTQVQIANTEQSVYMLLQGAEQIVPDQTPEQIQSVLSGNANFYQGIAIVVGYGVQIALFLIAFPPDSALLALHRRFNADASPSLTAAAMTQEKWRNLVSWILIGGDILTDFLHVVAGYPHLIIWNGLLPVVSGASFGVLLIGLLYPTTICFVTIFCFKYLLVFVESLFDKLKSRGA